MVLKGQVSCQIPGLAFEEPEDSYEARLCYSKGGFTGLSRECGPMTDA